MKKAPPLREDVAPLMRHLAEAREIAQTMSVYLKAARDRCFAIETGPVSPAYDRALAQLPRLRAAMERAAVELATLERRNTAPPQHSDTKPYCVGCGTIYNDHNEHCPVTAGDPEAIAAQKRYERNVRSKARSTCPLCGAG